MISKSKLSTEAEAQFTWSKWAFCWRSV